MKNIDNDIIINQFGQNLSSITEVVNYYNSLDEYNKEDFINKLLFFIIQLKPNDEIINDAIKFGGLKETFTPSVLIKKGINYNNLNRIKNLPVNEFQKSLSLLLSLFYISYQKEFSKENYSPNKWWFNDLSNKEDVLKIKSLSNFRVELKRLFNDQNIETGCIMNAILPISISLYEKNLIEKRLELHAFNIIYPKSGLNIYKSIYNDTVSLVIIKGINELSSIHMELAIY